MKKKALMGTPNAGGKITSQQKPAKISPIARARGILSAEK